MACLRLSLSSLLLWLPLNKGSTKLTSFNHNTRGTKCPFILPKGNYQPLTIILHADIIQFLYTNQNWWFNTRKLKTSPGMVHSHLLLRGPSLHPRKISRKPIVSITFFKTIHTHTHTQETDTEHSKSFRTWSPKAKNLSSDIGVNAP